MMKLALKIENREIVQKEVGLKSVYGGKPQTPTSNIKTNMAGNPNEN